jgi:hypothetical protein
MLWSDSTVQRLRLRGHPFKGTCQEKKIIHQQEIAFFSWERGGCDKTMGDVGNRQWGTDDNGGRQWGTLFKNIKNILIRFIDCGNEGSCHGKPD